MSSQNVLLATFVLHYRATNVSTVKFSCQGLKNSNWEQEAGTLWIPLRDSVLDHFWSWHQTSSRVDEFRTACLDLSVSYIQKVKNFTLTDLTVFIRCNELLETGYACNDETKSLYVCFCYLIFKTLVDLDFNELKVWRGPLLRNPL